MNVHEKLSAPLRGAEHYNQIDASSNVRKTLDTTFPPTDERALDLNRSLLIARGSEINVDLVAPGVTDIASRIGENYLAKVKEVKLHNMKLEEYVDVLSESMPSLMRAAAAEDTEVRGWIERIYITPITKLAI